MNISAKTLLTILFTAVAISASAQSDLVFNKRFVECEDKWVAFQKGKDSAYMFGFIYIDAMAGLTLNYESSFTVDANGKFLRKSLLDSSMSAYKIRLQNNNVKVALIPELRFAELKIMLIPDWLKVYKSYTDTAARLQRWGFYYNDFGMSEKALEYLEPGYKMAPGHKGMAIELAFAYNALGKFEEAVPVLNKAVELTSDDWYLYKELSYAQMKTGKLEEAGLTAMKGIKHAKENQMKVEMAYNITYSYFQKKDKAGFAKWVAETRKWVADGDKYSKSLTVMESKLNE